MLQYALDALFTIAGLAGLTPERREALDKEFGR